MNFNQTHFTTSADRLAGCPGDSLAEIAFAGRSNAGKSSAINAITGQKALADQQDAGRTQLINFFEVESGRYLVDLPGYGFAKVPLAVKDKWQRELENICASGDAGRPGRSVGHPASHEGVRSADGLLVCPVRTAGFTAAYQGGQAEGVRLKTRF